MERNFHIIKMNNEKVKKKNVKCWLEQDHLWYIKYI